MAKAYVKTVDASSDAPLSGAVVQLIDSEGAVVVEHRLGGSGFLVCGPEALEGLPEGTQEVFSRADVVVAEGFTAGIYTVRSVEPPYSDVSSEDQDGRTVTLRKTYRCSEKLIMVEEGAEAASYELLHEPTGEEKMVYEDGTDASKERAEALLSALAHPKAALAQLRKPFLRDHMLSDSERNVVGGAWIASGILTAVAFLWLVAPFLHVAAMSLQGLVEPGFGTRFAGGNLAAYARSYALTGWSAVEALRDAYPELGPPPALVNGLAAALLVAIEALEARWFARRFVPKNPILEERPETAGHGEYGTARLVTERAEVEDSYAVCADDAVPQDAGMYVGFYGSGPYAQLASAAKGAAACALGPSTEEQSQRVIRGEYILLPGDLHTIIFGDTRAGKTRRLLLATIYTILKNPGESAIIFDPKGELYGYLVEALEAQGVECVRVDFKNPQRSSRWNMLDLAIDAYEAGDLSRASLLVGDVVAELAPAQDNEGPSRYFNDGARAYIKSAALKVIADPSCPRDQKTIATVSRIIEAFGSAVELDPGKPHSKTFVPYAEMLESLPLDHPAVETYSGARGANDKELKAFCSTVQTYLSLFRDPALASMTMTTDNPFRNVATKRQAVFLIVPERPAYAPFAKMYLNQAYASLIDFADSGGAGAADSKGAPKTASRLPQRVNFICEELCSIPKWDNLVNATNIGAGRGIRFFLIVQNKALFEAKYEREAAAILSNCNNKVFIKTGDTDNTAKWLCDQLGSYTIELSSKTLSGGRFSPVMTRKSVNYTLTRRETLTVNEISRWKADYGAIVLTGDHAHVIPLPDVSQTPVQRELGLGDMRHNLEKVWNVMYGSPPREDEKVERWSPELTKISQGKKYSDKQRRDKRARYIAKLAADYKKRTYRQSGEQGQAQGALMGVLLNPATGEQKSFPQVNEAFVKAVGSPKFRGWKWKVSDSTKEIQAWAAEETEKAKGRKPDAKPDGQMLLIDPGTIELRGAAGDV